jgi:hypothetical protein
MKLTGHKTEAVYRRYAIVSETDLSEAVSKLQSLKPVHPPSAMGTKTGTLTHKTVQSGSEKKRSKSAGSSWKERVPGTGIEPVCPFRNEGF